MKKKRPEREVDINVFLEVNLMGGFLTERYASIEPFGFSMDVLG